MLVDDEVSPSRIHTARGPASQFPQAIDLESLESTAISWCESLHRELSAHPHLTELMTTQHCSTLHGYVDGLLKASLQEGISRERADECCRSLVNLIINDAIVNTCMSSE